MKHTILNSAITAAMAIGLAACSSGSDVAGIGGSGITSSGTVTGFGSFYQNGVKYDDTNATVTRDDNPSTSDQLKLGMRVSVTGTVNADDTGVANTVSISGDLEGPVDNIQTTNIDTTRTLTILGRQVRISVDTTNFDVSGLVGPVPFDFDNIQNTDHVEIFGFLDANNVMNATLVELKARPFNASSLVEVKGVIENHNTTNNTFNLVGASSTTISYVPGTTVIDNNLPGGIADDAFVEVKGTCADASCADLDASKVESGLDDFADNEDVEYEGVVTGFTDADNFEVNGIPVSASGATRTPAGFVPALNQEVEVEGTYNGTTLVATKVKDESNDLKIEDRIFDVDPANNSFRLEPVESSGELITVIMDKSTEVEDEVGGITNPDDLINSLSSGQFVSVEGYNGGTGTIIASEIERETPSSGGDDVIVQGIILSLIHISEPTRLQ